MNQFLPLFSDRSYVTEASHERFYQSLYQSLILLKEELGWTIEDIVYFTINKRFERFLLYLSSSIEVQGVNHSFRSNESKPVLSDDLKSKIRSWNRADSALFDAVNSTFWARIQNFGFDNMEMQVQKLRSGLRIATYNSKLILY